VRATCCHCTHTAEGPGLCRAATDADTFCTGRLSKLLLPEVGLQGLGLDGRRLHSSLHVAASLFGVRHLYYAAGMRTIAFRCTDRHRRSDRPNPGLSSALTSTRAQSQTWASRGHNTYLNVFYADIFFHRSRCHELYRSETWLCVPRMNTLPPEVCWDWRLRRFNAGRDPSSGGLDRRTRTGADALCCRPCRCCTARNLPGRQMKFCGPLRLQVLRSPVKIVWCGDVEEAAAVKATSARPVQPHRPISFSWMRGRLYDDRLRYDDRD
jgi:hypothetical protein